MAEAHVPRRLPARKLSPFMQIVIGLAVCAAIGFVVFVTKARSAHEASTPAAPASKAEKAFVPTPAQMATFTVRPVEERVFQMEHTTEGKVSIDEDRATPIFSPYSGRVIRLVAKQGDLVDKGQILFTIEATDMVQAQNDLIAAIGAVNKSRSQLQLAQTVEKRQRDLYEAKAVSLRELQNAQNDLVTAQNDVRASNGQLEAVRNRLGILGKTEGEINAFIQGGRMSPETPIPSPIAGTVTQRRIGPGQFVSGSSSDPAYTIGDLSVVWLLAQVRESEAPRITVGQDIWFRVLAFPNRTFNAKVSYIASSVDPATRRVQVRAVVNNADGVLKPEMFASVHIATGKRETSVAVPREAVIYEGDQARVWVIKADGALALREIETGLVDKDLIQVKSGLGVGERVVVQGSLFIDRVASGDVY